MNPHLVLIDAYFEDMLTDEQFRLLVDWLHQDAEHPRIFALQVQLRCQIHEQLRGEEVCACLLDNIVSETEDDSYCNSSVIDLDLIETLLAIDQSADGVVVDLSEELSRRHVEEKARQAEEGNGIYSLRQKHEPVKPVRRIVIPRLVFYGAIAAVVALTAMLFWPNQSPTLQVVQEKPTAPQLVQVATLVEQVDAKWLGISTSRRAPGGNSPAPGDALLNQKIHLTAGLAKIRFNNEAEVILEAPCSIKPISASEIEITHGKLVGRCGTLASRGFVVQTPGAKIVDLGTEFGVLVDKQGAAQAHVFEGEIELTASALRSPIKLRRNEARRVDSAGVSFSAAQTNELDFIRSEEFEANTKANESPYHRWLAHSYKLRRDPNLVAYYPFDNQSEAPNQLLNRAIATQGQLIGRLESQTDQTRGPQWTTGRFGWPKQALRFDADSREYVRVAHHSSLNFENAVTIAMWVNVHDPLVIHHLLTKRANSLHGRNGSDAINFAWVGDAPDTRHHDYSILFHTHYTTRWIDYETDSILKNQTGWTHLAVTYDQNERIYYLNGERLGRIADSTPMEQNLAPMLIGGVYASSNPHFGGLMDELVIFNEAISEQDIRDMYEAGRP